MAQPMDDRFFGKFKLISSDNFDAFLKEIKIGFMQRKVANMTSPDLQLIKEDDGWTTIKVNTPIKTITNRFKLGEFFDETRVDGKVCKSKIEFQPPNKFIQMQWDDGLEIKYVREFVDNKINVTSSCNGVECFRVYERAE
ncbi:Group 13 mite allergen-like protein (Lipocalin) [Euroglyphus maynei]|uniref:Group 13 mite allergen-like protein (Lipocalin) n=1 Tax=Euroglyphus maynei TaxID=6958 RepID=A0A1Y3BEM6_EURMA|nr:Group 13 mite allergen-like protein (Lipocalin) [Euroglyphus maynei]